VGFDSEFGVVVSTVVFDTDFGVEIKVFFDIIIVVVFAKHLAGVSIASSSIFIFTRIINNCNFI